MKKSILNLKGVQELTKTEQKSVFGKGAGDQFHEDFMDYWHSFLLPKPCPPGPCYFENATGCINRCKEVPKPRT